MSGMKAQDAEIGAAGGVVWRRAAKGLQFVLVHRPRYDDWSLPKGKLDAGETWEDCARREVGEETGLRCRLGAELPDAAYRDRRGRSKRVRYWLMQPLGGEFAPNDEVDELRWLDPAAATQLASHPRDAELVRAAVASLAEPG